MCSTAAEVLDSQMDAHHHVPTFSSSLRRRILLQLYFFSPDLSENQVAWNSMHLWIPFLKTTVQLVLDGKVSESLLHSFFFFLPQCRMLSLSGIAPINKSKHNLMFHLSNQLVSASYGNYSIIFTSPRLNKWVLVTSHLESIFFFFGQVKLH